jgi:hypothetical protein
MRLTLDGIKLFTVCWISIALTIGDWNRVNGIDIGRNKDVFREWKWMQGENSSCNKFDVRNGQSIRAERVHQRSRRDGNPSSTLEQRYRTRSLRTSSLYSLAISTSDPRDRCATTSSSGAAGCTARAPSSCKDYLVSRPTKITSSCPRVRFGRS